MEVFLLVSALVGFLVLIYRYATAYADYFDQRGIKYRKPTFLLGNLGPIIFQRTTPTANLTELYRQFSGEKAYGFFEFRRPTIILRDLELIKRVFIKDFDHFVNHTAPIDEQMDSILGNGLISLKGQKWKDMRTMLSPMFTGNKIRHMVPLVGKCAEDLCRFVDKKQKVGGEMVEWDVRELLAKCLVEVIGSCAFGIEVDSFDDPDNEFDRAAKYLMSQSDIRKVVRFLLIMVLPKVCKLFGMELFDEKYKRLFRRLVSETMKARERDGTSRPDLVQLLMQAKRGKLSVENDTAEDSFSAAKDHFESGSGTAKSNWSDEELTAQAVLFFAAGFDTTSTLLSFTLVELALSPEIQDRLIAEIDSVDEPFTEVTYEQIQKLRYLDAVISESLRKWPPLPATDRKCVKDYVLNNPEDDSPMFEIEQDRTVWIPIYCFHHDPKYFPNPERFDPERFNDSNRQQLNQAAYMPFGVGPRNCIGSRFALMSAKMILFRLLQSYRVDVCPKTDTKMELSKTKMNMTMDKGHWVYLQNRK
ncbi:cytochrome P450 9e2-like [Ochlerotatus camptorhynchus]|uniref:cytochrome P450 9e2-like n=1 Tax=Ochlerotatus camptorhynchus TaxID=644619 RepID=UPI0031D14E67